MKLQITRGEKMKKLFISAFIFVLFLLFQSLALAAVSPPWYKVTSGTTNNLNHCYFFDSQNGWAVGDNFTALYTTDGGGTWKDAQIGSPKNVTLTSVFLTAADEAWITASNGTIYHLPGRGQSWDVWTVTNVPLNDIYMTSKTSGYAVGEDEIYKYDGTLPIPTWTQVASAPAGDIYYGVSFSRFSTNAEKAGVVVGSNAGNGKIIYTTDRGTNWTAVSGGPTFSPLRKACFASASDVYAVGDSGTIIKSYNGNTATIGNWGLSNNGAADVGNNYKDVYFADDKNGWVGGNNGIYTTTNGGSNWNKVTDLNDPINGVFAIDSNHAWAVGDGGVIYVYSSPPPASIIPSPVDVSVTNSTVSVSLSWTPASGATSYQVYRSVKSQGGLKLSDDFSSSTLSSQWTIFPAGIPFVSITTDGKLHVILVAQSDSSPTVAGVYANNIPVDTTKMIDISSDVDILSAVNNAMFAGPSIFTSPTTPKPGTYILSYLEKLGLGYGVGYAAPVPTKDFVPVIIDSIPTGSGKLRTLAAGNYASIFYNGIYKGKANAPLSGSDLKYWLLGLASPQGGSMDIKFDNFTVVEYPKKNVASLPASSTTYTDTDVTIGETYFYYVVPVNTLGNSSGSNIVEAKVTAVPTTTTTSTTPTTTTTTIPPSNQIQTQTNTTSNNQWAGQTITINNTPGTIYYIIIRNNVGRVVFSKDIIIGSNGSFEYTWNGTDSVGNRVPSGVYQITGYFTDASGNKQILKAKSVYVGGQ